METTKMTIHRALAELKLIDAKIEKGMTEIHPTSIYQKDKKIEGYLTEEEFTSNAKRSYQSVTDLINRKIAIKSAIVKSNAETQVKIGDKTMSVSDAITFKTVIDAKKKMILVLNQKNKNAISQLNKNNEIVQKNVEILLANALGKDSIKASKEDVDNISTPYLLSNTWHLADPLKVSDEILKLEKEVSDFETEVDAVLSETNAITFINI